MPVAELVDGKILLATEFREKEQTKLLPGVKWDANTTFPGAEKSGVWWMPLSWAACIQLRGVFGQTLHVGGALGTWARAEVAERIGPCLELRTAEDSPDLAMMSALHPFQRAGAKFLSTARHALIADEMGLGKTVQAIAALEALGDAAYPALIVAPNSMKFTWKDEFVKWAPGRLAVVINGSAAARRKQIEQLAGGEADVGIINYEGLRLHTRLAPYGSVTLAPAEKEPKELNRIAFKSVVADEAHRAKDPRAKQTRALWAVSDRVDQRFALTGTPVANSPEDIWTLMRFVAPPEFPAKTRFIERYAQQSWNVFGFMQVIGINSENSEELFKILDPRMIRRTKAAVLPQLPPKVYSTRAVEMVPKQAKAYEMIRREMMAELEGGTLLATNPLAQLTRLIQFASAYGVIETDDAGAESLILTEPSCKVDALMEIVDELGDQSAVIFAESRQLIEIAAKRLQKNSYRIGLITGSIPPHERQENVTAFNSNQIKLLLLTLGAGGEGLSFPGCTTAIFLQRSFSLVKNLQAEDRIHGIGRGSADAASHIIDIITANSVEAKVHASCITKAEQLEQVVRDAETLRKWLSK